MKNNSFARAMDSIVQQAEAERQQEIKSLQRAEWFGRVRKACGVFFLATVLIFTYQFHDKLGDVVATIMPNKAAALGLGATSGSTANTTTTGKAAVALQGASANAAVRDQLIDSLAK